MRHGTGRETAVIVIAGVVLALVMPLLIDTHVLTLIIAHGLLALSLGLIWGFGGVLCFGQAAFFGLGAYTFAIAGINLGESTVPVILAVLVPAAFALALGAMMFYGRLGDVYLAVITLVVTLILYRWINSTAGPDYVIGSARLGGYNGIPGFPILNVPGRPDLMIWGETLYHVAAATLLIVFVLVTWLLRSSFGRIAVGIRENEERVSLLGFDIRARKTILFAIGAAIAGLAGALYATWAEVVTPSLFSLQQSAEIIIWCIVGGLGTRFGPILGASVLAYLKFSLGQQNLVDNMFVLGLVLVLFVLFLPRGLAPELARGWQRIAGVQRKPARRRRAPKAEAHDG
ncbi:MAG: branched-chain amino acid transport system permease protein [Rhodobacteraceae bacterium HLUCCA12]|nr:MAG: branched-chain amino acid transport system permease protein [Rhodobacteraceae bacterium HLUCCA12]